MLKRENLQKYIVAGCGDENKKMVITLRCLNYVVIRCTSNYSLLHRRFPDKAFVIVNLDKLVYKFTDEYPIYR